MTYINLKKGGRGETGDSQVCHRMGANRRALHNAYIAAATYTLLKPDEAEHYAALAWSR
jgi:hypothetical protein